MNHPEIMDVRQAADYLGITADTLYKYLIANRIPAFKLGARWRFKKSVLDEWIGQKISNNRQGDRPA